MGKGKPKLTGNLLRQSVAEWNEARQRHGKKGRPNLSYEDLSGLDLREADLSFANLERANLEGTDLRDAKLLHANLCGATLERANLEGVNLTGVTWCESSLGFLVEGADVGLGLETAVVAAISPDEYQVLLNRRRELVKNPDPTDDWDDADCPF